MNLGPYRFNIDVLLVRIIYHWRRRLIATLLLMLALAGFESSAIPPLWKGRAELTIVATRAAAVTVDGQPWPRPVYAGHHSIPTGMPDGRDAWADIQLMASLATCCMVRGVGSTALLLADGERTPLMIPMWPETIHQIVTGRSRNAELRR